MDPFTIAIGGALVTAGATILVGAATVTVGVATLVHTVRNDRRKLQNPSADTTGPQHFHIHYHQHQPYSVPTHWVFFDQYGRILGYEPIAPLYHPNNINAPHYHQDNMPISQYYLPENFAPIPIKQGGHHRMRDIVKGFLERRLIE